MAGLWRIVTAALLVTHLMVGCCAHHSHACEAATHSSSDVDVDASGTHGECFHSPGCQADHDQHGPQDCQGDKCSFVFRGQLANYSFGQLQQAFLAVLPDARPSLGEFRPEQPSLASGRLLLPVRLHLANQVLLI